MSSVQVDRPTKMGQVSRKETDKSRKPFNPSHKKHKHEDGRYFKFGRKRLQSFTTNGKFFPPYKRRKKEGIIIPPTKFLLGGNICDPLNLNSMQDEEVNRAMNAVTPKSSPLPTPKHRKETIEVIIPPNICDPLNLSNCDNEDYEKQLISPTKKGSKRRNRKRKRASSGSGKDDANEAAEAKSVDTVEIPTIEISEVGEPKKPKVEPVLAPPSPLPNNPPKEAKQENLQKEKNKLRLKGLEDPKDKRLRKVDIKDKIVSPVIPQPGAWKTRPQHRPSQDKKKKAVQQTPNFREKDARYQYGNYNRYYGYRNPHHDVDSRLPVFAQRKELFIGKDVLDIGCNIGHITLSVARDFSARSVTGIDIDRTLINIARKNIKHYVNCVQSPASIEDGAERKDCDPSFFPMSMPINYGPIDIPGFTKNSKYKGFPYNITFVQGNYVLEDDALLSSEQPQFDTILCLSITKWIHLNFGDAGLKQAFKRMHAQLRPGGVLVLEPQNWSSYGKKKNLTERIHKNYQSIEFLPHKFTQYLLSSEGFQRPVHLFTKATLSPEAASGQTPGTSTRIERRDHEQRELERREYERELFPKETKKEGNMSEISQRSSESLSQYEQLENVYAPSATPCYDTPGYTEDSQPLVPAKMCYVDLGIDNDRPEEKESKEVSEKQCSEEKLKRARGSDPGDKASPPTACKATPITIENPESAKPTPMDIVADLDAPKRGSKDSGKQCLEVTSQTPIPNLSKDSKTDGPTQSNQTKCPETNNTEDRQASSVKSPPDALPEDVPAESCDSTSVHQITRDSSVNEPVENRLSCEKIPGNEVDLSMPEDVRIDKGPEVVEGSAFSRESDATPESISPVCTSKGDLVSDNT
ncbi:7SK snRNA methylphosphate capping enzyme isoform X2 [Orussus abietinus]|uniref:7SK snRNA methylphosphate capping enzyme isoform X2 n=1 Tax=Orussus abietinus TaxID=222816 RepID=UPI000C715BC5|nr:7SK snRNA methylphosphate capping enzyme isoform X2 [Orussus abietinus]